MNLNLSDRFFYRAVLVCMIAYLVFYMLANYSIMFWDLESPSTLFYDALEPGVFILSIVVLLLIRKKTLKRTMIVLGIVLSILSLFNAYLTLVEYGPHTDYSVYSFIEGTLELFAGVFLIINILMFVAKLSNDMTMMFCAAAGLLFINITDMLSPLRYEFSIEYTIQVFSIRIPMIALLVLMMMITKSRSIASETNLYAIKASFIDIRDTGVPIGVIMLRSDLQRISDAVCNDGLDPDCVIHLKSSYSNEYRFVFTKKDSKIYAALSSLHDTSAIDSHRFVLRGIDPDTGDIGTCDTVRFYSEDGFFYQMIVVDAFPEPQNAAFRKLLNFRNRDDQNNLEESREKMTE